MSLSCLSAKYNGGNGKDTFFRISSHYIILIRPQQALPLARI